MSSDPDQYFTKDFVEKVTRICFNTVKNEIGDCPEIQGQVASETLLRLWEYRDKIDFLTGQVWGYVKRIAKNCFSDLGKKGLKDDKKIVQFMPSDKLPEECEIQSINYNLLIEDIVSLISDPVDKKIVEKWVEGYEKASEILPFVKKFGINDSSAVSKRLKKIKEKVKKYYEGN